MLKFNVFFKNLYFALNKNICQIYFQLFLIIVKHIINMNNIQYFSKFMWLILGDVSYKKIIFLSFFDK